jgi:hypothetical protein
LLWRIIALRFDFRWLAGLIPRSFKSRRDRVGVAGPVGEKRIGRLRGRID